jgi:hypothetical protein
MIHVLGLVLRAALSSVLGRADRMEIFNWVASCIAAQATSRARSRPMGAVLFRVPQSPHFLLGGKDK